MRAYLLLFNLFCCLTFSPQTFASDLGCRWWIDANKESILKKYNDIYSRVAVVKQQIDIYYWVIGLINEKIEKDQEDYPFIKKVLLSVKKGKIHSDLSDLKIFNEYYKQLLTKMNFDMSWHACGEKALHTLDEKYRFSDRCQFYDANKYKREFDEVLEINTLFISSGQTFRKTPTYFQGHIPKNYSRISNNYVIGSDLVLKNLIEGFFYISHEMMFLKQKSSSIVGVYPLTIESVMRKKSLNELLELMFLPDDKTFEQFAMQECKNAN